MEETKTMRYGRILEYLSMKSRVMHLPTTGTLELTPLCNMNCKMCYIRMTEQEMNAVGTALPAEEWIRIAQEAVDAGMTQLLFTGGEAILYKDFRKVYLAAREMGVFISINTNGTVLTDSWIEFFKEYPPSKFNITIYGGSNETYERLCGNPRGFDQLKAGIEKLQANGFEILLNCTLTRQNSDDMEPIFAFAREHHLEVHATTYCFPPVRKEGVIDPELDRFSAEKAARAKIQMNWVKFGRNSFLSYAKRVLEKLEHTPQPEETDAAAEGGRVTCAAGRANFWITWDGRMLPCGMIPGASVSIRGRSFREAWQEIVERTAQIRLAPECARCPKKEICSPCAAKIKSETGAYGKKPQYLCDYTDEYIRLLGEAVKYLEHEQKNG